MRWWLHRIVFRASSSGAYQSLVALSGRRLPYPIYLFGFRPHGGNLTPPARSEQ